MIIYHLLFTLLRGLVMGLGIGIGLALFSPSAHALDNNRTVDKSHSAGQSASIDVNINGVLLQEFMRRYESPENPGETQSQQAFGNCLPLTGMVTEYPTLNSCPTLSLSGSAIGSIQGVDLNFVVPRRNATHFVDGSCGTPLLDGGGKTNIVRYYEMEPSTPTTRKYALCRIYANAWLDEAGRRAVKAEVQSEEEIAVKIRETFAVMDRDEQLFSNIMNDSKALWSRANCAPKLTRWNDFVEPDINCGVLVIKGDTVKIAGRQTLAESSINGRSYSIALKAGDDTKSSTSAKEQAPKKKKAKLNPLRH